MNTQIFWIGIRESELMDCTNLFAGSITIFGSGKNGNRAFDHSYWLRYDYNQDSEKWEAFVKSQILEICRENPSARFLLYYPGDAVLYESEIKSRLICQNDDQIIEILDDKQQTRSWLSNSVPVLPYMTRMGSDLSYAEMCQAFPGYQTFALQEKYSCGGSGTYYIDSQQKCDQYLDEETGYSVSPYIKNNISPNVHLIIYANEVLLLPPSVQLFGEGSECFRYRGADFALFQYLPFELRQKVYHYSKVIGERLRFAGYRGVCGIDFLCDDQEVYFMEINARFQSSSFLINKAMRENGINNSLQNLHMDAFLHKTCSYEKKNFTVDYSFWGYNYNSAFREQLRYIHELHSRLDNGIVQCIDDFLDWNMPLEEDTYVFKSIFKGNIASLTPYFSCRLHSNININAFVDKIGGWSQETAMRWKILLLNHGVRVNPQMIKLASPKGGINFEEFSAVDMLINKQVYVNAPYNQNRSQLSPFEVTLSPSGKPQLCFAKKKIADVELRTVDPFSQMHTSTGVPYDEIAYLSNDRLRIFHRSGCYFKSRGIGCKFCDVEVNGAAFSFEDIKEVITAYKNRPEIQHYLIGGGSDSPDSDFNAIIKIAGYIRSETQKPIYLMSLPPKDKRILQLLKESGVTEVAFNLEVYDRTLAIQCMPGKGKFTLQTYLDAFEESIRLWGREGNVRTMFIVGLEPVKSLLAGIEHVCSMGVSPILSLFKPIANTPLSYMLAPSDTEIYDIYTKALTICEKYHVPLGPTCHFCEDNTLKISFT